MKTQLYRSEWLIALSFFLVMGSLVFIAKINASRASSAISGEELHQKEFIVVVSGAVFRPGEYVAKEGSLLGNIIKKAKPKAHANLRSVSMSQIIDGPLNMQIEELSEIQVTIRGAVEEEVKLTVPASSRIADLKSKLSFDLEADKAFFRSKKKLKDGDVIIVPKKTVEKKRAD